MSDPRNARDRGVADKSPSLDLVGTILQRRTLRCPHAERQAPDQQDADDLDGDVLDGDGHDHYQGNESGATAMPMFLADSSVIAVMVEP